MGKKVKPTIGKEGDGDGDLGILDVETAMETGDRWRPKKKIGDCKRKSGRKGGDSGKESGHEIPIGSAMR